MQISSQKLNFWGHELKMKINSDITVITNQYLAHIVFASSTKHKHNHHLEQNVKNIPNTSLLEIPTQLSALPLLNSHLQQTSN